MKKKSIKNNRILIVFASLLVIIIVSFIVLKTNSKSSEVKIDLKYINSGEWKNEPYPDGMPKLFRNYSGELKAQNIGKSMYYTVTKTIPYYINNKVLNSEREIKKYYNRNKKLIQLQFGKLELNQFQNLITEFKKISGNNIEFESFYIDKDSIKEHGSVTSGILFIKYKDNDEINVLFNVSGRFNDKYSSIKYYK